MLYTYEMTGPKCPYCGYLERPEDGHLYDENLSEHQCGSCEKTFDMRVYNSTSGTCTARPDADTSVRQPNPREGHLPKTQGDMDGDTKKPPA